MPEFVDYLAEKVFGGALPVGADPEATARTIMESIPCLQAIDNADQAEEFYRLLVSAIRERIERV